MAAKEYITYIFSDGSGSVTSTKFKRYPNTGDLVNMPYGTNYRVIDVIFEYDMSFNLQIMVKLDRVEP